jgi:DNA repair protein RadC
MRYKDCGSLSLKELISITLRESNDSPVVEELLQRFSTVSDLYRASVYELTTIKGLGLAASGAKTMLKSLIKK